MTCCRDCISGTAGYQLKSHETEEVVLPHDQHDLGPFQTKIRSLLPATLIFTEEDLSKVDEAKQQRQNDNQRITHLSKRPFYLHRIYRDFKKWIVLYYARESGNPIGEIRLTLGELQRLDEASFKNQHEVGLRVDVTSFLPARREPLIFGKLDPSLTFDIQKVSNGSLKIGEWKTRTEGSSLNALYVKGKGSTDSPRVRVGLEDSVAKKLKDGTQSSSNRKMYAAACQRNETRRWIYAENWEVYPQVLSISGDTTVDGEYELAPCEHTVNMSSLWIRKSSNNDQSALYLTIQPNVDRTGPDQAVISSSICHKDTISVIATFPLFWEPSDALIPDKEKVKLKFHGWKPVPNVNCLCTLTNLDIQSPVANKENTENIFLTIHGLTDTNVNLLSGRIASDREVFELPLVGGQKAQQNVRVFNSICSIPIQKHAAKGNLNFKLDPGAPWNHLDTKEGMTPYGFCNVCNPPKPPELWVFDEERGRWDRRYESKMAREFTKAIENAPKPFKFIIDKMDRSLTIKYSTNVAAHQVAKQLIGERGIGPNEASIYFRFSDTGLQTDPVITPFKVKSCENEIPTDVSLTSPYELYPRQQKVVTKMYNIEASNTEFEELEMLEHQLPGSTGISMICKATRKTRLRGGVIADAIGAGKTVISIGLILKGLQEAWSSRNGPLSSSASLVVMPPGLLRQWKVSMKLS